ncbi:MAG: hypothetical protein GXP31_03000 [Kiritimatiellaeota bacterium]|nr:hypothetical protein [Kiritimatiellota bacterium]
MQTSGSNASSPGPAIGADPALPAFMFLAGFTTITSQVLLIREIFTALYGSDAAMAFALAAWTLLGGLGAFFAAPLAGRLKRIRAEWGLVLFTVASLGVFLWARAWGAKDVLGFRDYLRVPVFLLVPCVLGGALFPWRLARCAVRNEVETSRAYAFETLGGLWAGLCMAGYVYSGGLSLPALLLLPVLILIAPRLAGRRARGWLLVAGLGLACLTVARTSWLEGLSRHSLELRLPGYRILAHVNTPFSAMTAAERNGAVFVFENGLPTPENRPTRSKAALLTFLAQFPERWGHVFLLRPVSAGFAGTARYLRDCRLDLWETDRAKMRFLARWQKFDLPPGLHVSASPWRALSGRSSDLIVVLGAEPASLLANRCLTREFLASAAGHLAPGGVLAVVLPTAPGYLHPRQVRYLRTVRAALGQCLPHTAEYRTDLGGIVFVGSRKPLSTRFVQKRTRERLTAAVDAGAEAQAAAVFFDAAMRRSLGPAAVSETPPPVNSVVFPAAYYAYLLFRGAMIETAETFWDRVFHPMPWAAVVLVGLLLVLTGALEPGLRGASALFWGSWVTTMALVYSLYLSQSVAGQAYWLVALLTAAGMVGIFLGAHRTRPWIEDRRTVLVVLILPGLFPALPIFERLPEGLLFMVLAFVNAVLGARMGGLFRRTVRWGRTHAAAPAAAFGLDLLGAAGGLCAGGVLLPWWAGFRTAALLCAAAAMAGELLAFARRER